MQRLNPYAKTARALEEKAAVARSAARKAALKHKHSKAGRKEKSVRSARFNALSGELEAAFAQAKQVVDDEIKAGLYNPNE
jgi:hypothetical protein